MSDAIAPAGEDKDCVTFEELVTREFHRLHPKEGIYNMTLEERRETLVGTAPPGPAEEPWIAFSKHDHFGLALSGGGIRSATFNLGLLQALQRNDILKDVDYLSTVSGGGYVGGFWTRWLHGQWDNLVKNQPWAKGDDKKNQLDMINERRVEMAFPQQERKVDDPIPPCSPAPPGRGNGPAPHSGNNGHSGSNLNENREREEFRHLREFSRFLMPRVGFGQAETWGGIVTILAGLIPSLAGATALVIVGVYAWLKMNFFLLADEAVGWKALIVATFTIGFQAWGEIKWRRFKAGEGKNPDKKGAVFLIILTGILAGAFWFVWRSSWLTDTELDQANRWLSYWRGQLTTKSGPQLLSYVLFGPALAWILAAAVLMVARFLTSRQPREQESLFSAGALDRCAGRCLAPAVAWAGTAACWELSRWLHWRGVDISHSTGGMAVFGGLFFWLRDWLMAPQQESRGTRLLQKIAAVLKPLTPQLLAAAGVVCFCVSVILLVQTYGLHWWHARLFWSSSLALLLVLLLCFNPATVGMHDFYRARIARCFLGAARACDAAKNRTTSEQLADDLALCDKPGQLEQPWGDNSIPEKWETRYMGRPIHLICCAANNLAGDTLSSLYRGCRSAVLSPSGISLGDHTARLNELKLSSALTGSAAAFNSQMGRVSMRLGPAVAILMSALNLRLGLWVPHPLNPSRNAPALPGLFFLFEMFGYTRSDPRTDTLLEYRRRLDAPHVSRWRRLIAKLGTSRHLHLSDGGHFENLGLYELIRRRCRYIIVSDCSADPMIGFDDLANALRCVREDFGVEIELDVSPLRPTENRSAQHAVVGTIHYDGLNGNDKGTLLYFKPTLTGDEPPDVMQYHTRNPAFPHESTGDQFYDEAQWESYRRLGEHAANIVLRVQPTDKPANPVENLFLTASQRWHPEPPRQQESFLQLTERCAELEAEVRDQAPVGLRLEFFPEIAATGLVASPTPRTEDETKVVYFVMLAAQIMEDAWVSLELENYWSHPLNQGWMVYFQRWASTPSFRRWWPVVRSLYSPGFADFVKDRFNLRLHDYQARPEATVQGPELYISSEVNPPEAMAGMAWQHWLARNGEPDRSGRQLLTYNLRLDEAVRVPGCPLNSIQVGFLLFKKDAGIVQWNTPELFVPPTLINAEIMARFLDALIARFRADVQLKEIKVVLEETPALHRDESKQNGKSQKQKQPKFRQGFRPDPASRYERVNTLNFYKSRGFVCMLPGVDGQLRMLSLDLVALRNRPGL